MAIVIPDVTQVTPAGWGAVEIMAALYTHFNSTSTKFNVTAQNGTSPGEDGILLDVVSADWDFQINLRRLDASSIGMSCEPSGSLTDPGDTGTPVTGDSADWSDEATWSMSTSAGTPGSGSKMFVVETDEHFTCLITNTANSSHVSGCHVGEIYSPHFGNAQAAGWDGLGLMVGVPISTTVAGADFWISATSGSLFHTGTGFWNRGIQLNISENENDISSGFGIQPPIPIPIAFTTDTGATRYYGGNTKYYRIMDVQRSPKTRVENDVDDQAWMWAADTTEPYGIIWKRGAVP